MIARATGLSGTLIATVLIPSLVTVVTPGGKPGSAGNTNVSAPGQKACANRSAVAERQEVEHGDACWVGDKDGNCLLDRPSLEGIESFDRIRPIERRSESVDGIRRDGDDLLGAERTSGAQNHICVDAGVRSGCQRNVSYSRVHSAALICSATLRLMPGTANSASVGAS